MCTNILNYFAMKGYTLHRWLHLLLWGVGLLGASSLCQAAEPVYNIP